MKTTYSAEFSCYMTECCCWLLCVCDCTKQNDFESFRIEYKFVPGNVMLAASIVVPVLIHVLLSSMINLLAQLSQQQRCFYNQCVVNKRHKLQIFDVPPPPLSIEARFLHASSIKVGVTLGNVTTAPENFKVGIKVGMIMGNVPPPPPHPKFKDRWQLCHKPYGLLVLLHMSIFEVLQSSITCNYA